MKPGSRSAPAAAGGGGGGGGLGGGNAAGLARIPSALAPPAPSEKVVHSRSQALFRSGSPALGDALKLLLPRSTAFMSSDAELWDFLCSLKHEFSPVILRSKDVYGYASCRAVVPDLPRGCDQEARPGGSSSSSNSSRSRKGGAGRGDAPAAPAANKGKRPRTEAKNRPRGGGGGGGGGGKRAAKKRREDGQAPSQELWACERRREPAQSREWETLPDPNHHHHPHPPGPILEGNPLAAFPAVQVRGDIWKRRNLEAARRRAQRLWRVDLAPVVRLRRIPEPASCSC